MFEAYYQHEVQRFKLEVVHRGLMYNPFKQIRAMTVCKIIVKEKEAFHLVSGITVEPDDAKSPLSILKTVFTIEFIDNLVPYTKKYAIK